MNKDLAIRRLFYLIAFSAGLHSLLLSLSPPLQRPRPPQTVLQLRLAALPPLQPVAPKAQPISLPRATAGSPASKRRDARPSDGHTTTAFPGNTRHPATAGITKGHSTYSDEYRFDIEAIRQAVSTQRVGQRSPADTPTAPQPSQPLRRKTPLEQGIEKAERPDCHTAYAQFGLLAALPLLTDTLTAKGCKW